jgi:hypothetical protein
VPRRVEFVGDEPVAGLGVIVVDVERGVHQVGVVEVTSAHGVGEPGVVGLAGEPSTRHDNATGTAASALASWATRGNIIWAEQDRLRQVGRGLAQDFVLLLQQPVAPAQLTQLR